MEAIHKEENKFKGVQLLGKQYNSKIVKPVLNKTLYMINFKENLNIEAIENEINQVKESMPGFLQFKVDKVEKIGKLRCFISFDNEENAKAGKEKLEKIQIFSSSSIFILKTKQELKQERSKVRNNLYFKDIKKEITNQDLKNILESKGYQINSILIKSTKMDIIIGFVCLKDEKKAYELIEQQQTLEFLDEIFN